MERRARVLGIHARNSSANSLPQERELTEVRIPDLKWDGLRKSAGKATREARAHPEGQASSLGLRADIRVRQRRNK
jgi:hypothetical protein